MKEVTRIHIAKTSYDIELAAKKELEKYLQKLGRYTDSQDWLEDIEIRITEILADRKVQANGVISMEDVGAIKDQLGNPEDFLQEGDIAVGYDYRQDGRRRLYRNTDNAVLGGVLSGLASYINVNPLWTRIAFIILLGISFGTVIVLYLVLWLVIPPARTAAEKLQLNGRPVTLASIRELHEEDDTKTSAKSIAPIVQNILIYSLAVLAAISALGAFLLTIAVSIGVNIGVSSLIMGQSMPNTWEAWTAFTLCVLSGLLLGALFSVVSYALFKKKLTKRMGVAIVAIILSGLVTFSSAIGVAMYGSWRYYSQIDASSFTKTVSLPDKFSEIKNITVDTSSSSSNQDFLMHVEYVVDEGNPRYELTLNASSPQIAPKFSYSETGDAVSIAVGGTSNILSDVFFAYPSIKIYGPAVDNITVNSGSLAYKNAALQPSIGVSIGNEGRVELLGSYSLVTTTTRDTSMANLSNASVDKLIVNHFAGGVEAGVVREFEVTQAESCPAVDENDTANTVRVNAVSSGVLTYNGQQRSAKTVQAHCGSVIIGDRDEDDGDYEYRRG